jgi:hypothetical protein
VGVKPFVLLVLGSVIASALAPVIGIGLFMLLQGI